MTSNFQTFREIELLQVCRRYSSARFIHGFCNVTFAVNINDDDTCYIIANLNLK